MKEYIYNTSDNIKECIDFIEDTLKSMGTKEKERIKGMLMAEEIIAAIQSGDEVPGVIKIGIKKSMTIPSILITARGDNIFSKVTKSQTVDDDFDDSPETVEVIRNLILNSSKENFKIKNKNGNNTITIVVGEPSKRRTLLTLSSLILGILVGLLLKFTVSADIISFIDGNILSVLKNAFINLLKMLMCPLIFFSIAACISTMTDISEIGKVGGRVILFYMCTTVIAIFLAMGLFHLIPTVEFGSLCGMSGDSMEVATDSVSFSNTVMDIFPDNFFGAFTNANTLQIILIAVLLGVASIKMGDKGTKVAAFVDIANELFCTIGAMITKYLPVMVFASMCSLVVTMDEAMLKYNIGILLVVFLACILILLVYVLLAVIITRVNTLEYAKKVFPVWLNAFSLSSSTASIPFTMKTCEKELKISPKVFSFSIPLGATINMDGCSITLMLTTLFLAKGFGIEMGLLQYVVLVITIMLLSIGAPGIPGAAIVCEAVLMGQFGIPMVAMPIVIGLFTILDNIGTADNVCGDVCGTYIVAYKTGNVEK